MVRSSYRRSTATLSPGEERSIVFYMPYGVGSDGIVAINDLTKVLPPPYGTGTYVDPFRPTDDELLQSLVGVIYMPGVEGGHSSMPYYGIPLAQYANFTNNNVRDILAVSSEETDNRCTGSPHLLYLLDITQTIGQGGWHQRRAASMADLHRHRERLFRTAQLLLARHAVRRPLDGRELQRPVLRQAHDQRVVRRGHPRYRHPRSVSSGRSGRTSFRR